MSLTEVPLPHFTRYRIYTEDICFDTTPSLVPALLTGEHTRLCFSYHACFSLLRNKKYPPHKYFCYLEVMRMPRLLYFNAFLSTSALSFFYRRERRPRGAVPEMH